MFDWFSNEVDKLNFYSVCFLISTISFAFLVKKMVDVWIRMEITVRDLLDRLDLINNENLPSQPSMRGQFLNRSKIQSTASDDLPVSGSR